MWELLLRPLAWSALALLACYPLERLFPQHGARRRHHLTDLAFATLGQLFTRLLLVYGAHVLLSRVEAFAFDRERLGLRGTALVLFDLVLGLTVFELGGYFYHRLAHKLPWLWDLHAVHHSSEAMDGLAAFRQHPLEVALMTVAQNLPVILLGIPLGSHAALLFLLKLNTVFVHANIRISAGPLSYLVATPRFHHRHHQRFGAAKKFATLLSVFDLIFGTYSRKTSTLFGVEEKLPASFVGLLRFPFERALKGKSHKSKRGVGQGPLRVD